MTDRFFIFGAGYSCKAFARANSGGATIVGTTRSQAKVGDLQRAGVEPLLFDGATASPEILKNLASTTHLIVSIAPGDDGDPVLNTLRETITEKMPALCWIGYLSTVGVYGDHQGKWVDETSACKPVSRRSVARLEAERAWQDLSENTGVQLAILRLSGIYGPGRNAFVNLTNGTAKRLIKKDQVFNRIHVEDIAGALWRLAEQKIGGVFNVTDNEPAPPQDVVAFAAELMGVEPPLEQPFETAQISPMARSFYGENKRVANAKLKATGYQLRYPDYQASHHAMRDAGTWKGEGDAGARSTIRKG
jgi:nucleoside-diphosphate-sugar epimerase